MKDIDQIWDQIRADKSSPPVTTDADGQTVFDLSKVKREPGLEASCCNYSQQARLGARPASDCKPEVSQANCQYTVPKALHHYSIACTITEQTTRPKTLILPKPGAYPLVYNSSPTPTFVRAVQGMPPTPPSSQPGSPNTEDDFPPPPPYPGLAKPDLQLSQLLGSSMESGDVPRTPSGLPRSTHPGCTTIKYNRRNNPDLEKRRIHYCDFPGEYDLTIRPFFSYPRCFRRPYLNSQSA